MSTYRERLQEQGSLVAEAKDVADGEFRNVLVLFTGGTIGMILNEDCGV